ncbi:uncharacterized protein [Pyxicephalus adspersus]|uniref:uncharacterized protein n=1 Tax=Pyxicephalus adspersus TaxID=30357 RepID=UPI003B5CB886
MLLLLLLTWVLPSVRLAASLECFLCVNATYAACKENGIFVNCSSSELCISYYEKAFIGGKSTTLFFMMCGTCDMFKPTSVRFHKGTVKSNSTCCNTNRCTPSEPKIAVDGPVLKNENNNKKNVTCKSCYSSAKSCDCNIFMNCSGEEEKCIHRNTIVGGNHSYLMSVRGCTTDETCHACNRDIDNIKGFLLTSKYTCTGNSNFLLPTPLLLFLSAILLSFFRPVMS